MPKTNDIDIEANKRTIRSIENDGVKAAEAVHLVYISDEQPGIERAKKGRGMSIFIKIKRSLTRRK